MAAELSDHLDWAQLAIGRIAPASHARHAQFGVTAAVPVNGYARFIRRIVEVDHDLSDENVSNALLCSRIRARRVPRGRQVMCQCHQCRWIDFWVQNRRAVVLGNAVLEMSNALECRIPPCLKLASDKPLGRVDRFVTTRREQGLGGLALNT